MQVSRKNAQLEKNKNPIGKLFFSNWEIKMGVFYCLIFSAIYLEVRNKLFNFAAGIED
jgi:hypothetical protein